MRIKYDIERMQHLWLLFRLKYNESFVRSAKIKRTCILHMCNEPDEKTHRDQETPTHVRILQGIRIRRKKKSNVTRNKNGAILWNVNAI